MHTRAYCHAMLLSTRERYCVKEGKIHGENKINLSAEFLHFVTVSLPDSSFPPQQTNFKCN